MSLYMLNEGRDLHPGYRDVVDGTIGPSLVAAAITEQFGADDLSDWYTAFGSRIFDYWRVPGGDELLGATRYALASTGLPESLAAAGETGEYLDALRRSHAAGVAPVGSEAGTPIVHFNGIGFFGPVLNSVPRGEQAVRLFDAVREFAGFPDFFELKRTRVSAPVFG